MRFHDPDYVHVGKVILAPGDRKECLMRDLVSITQILYKFNSNGGQFRAMVLLIAGDLRMEKSVDKKLNLNKLDLIEGAKICDAR
ncbi:MAG: hypothetical protein JSV42_16635 [Chloroflexota bacterium]|nr:MAG: hypothetical protein JSV42_16635 [Chloroflexota bacterium]